MCHSLSLSFSLSLSYLRLIPGFRGEEICIPVLSTKQPLELLTLIMSLGTKAQPLIPLGELLTLELAVVVAATGMDAGDSQWGADNLVLGEIWSILENMLQVAGVGLSVSSSTRL